MLICHTAALVTAAAMHMHTEGLPEENWSNRKRKLVKPAIPCLEICRS